MSQTVKPIPEGFHTITPYLVVKGAADALAFYAKVFSARELYRNVDEKSGLIMNAQILIGDSTIMLNDEFPDFGCFGPSEENRSPVTLHLYVEDADAVFNGAVEAGCEVTMPLSDTFWGDRYGCVRDPFGHSWSIATRIEDLTPDEIKERSKTAFC